MDLKKVIALLGKAENELMAQVGLNELEYDALRELLNIAEQINDISSSLYDYLPDDDDDEDDDDEDDEDEDEDDETYIWMS